MLKYLFAFLFALAVLVAPASASADQGTDLRTSNPAVVAGTPTHSDGTLRHAYKPVTVTENGMMRARVNNMTSAPVNTLVCVEAFNNATSNKTHLGCLRVMLDPTKTDGMWAREFDAPTNWLKPGNYTIVYTYQGTNDVWHRVLSMQMTVQDGMYRSF